MLALDISNAFNSIPWAVVRKALRHKGYPEYLQRIIDSYLSYLSIGRLVTLGKMTANIPMESGVPQGSVLGPVLWNIAYDSVLRLAKDEENCEIICYADDTIVIITGKNVVHTFLKGFYTPSY